ncbi:MAG TPA: hypothetical protein VKH45_02880 [Candidatus Acidoferrum sp.]|nr:hypothetical protein [Candidatus Acidoferrum sp.]
MVFGHNTNVKIGAVTYHVQTEDRGEAHALIDTTVYYQGRVLHRRTNNYFDLLPANEDRQQALKLRVDEQHHTVLEEMQSGALHLAIPQPGTQPVVAAIEDPSANEDRQPALQLGVDEQHHAVPVQMQLEAALPTISQLGMQPVIASTENPKACSLESFPETDRELSSCSEEIAQHSPVPRKLNIELMNAKSWLAGKQATLRISVKEENGEPVAGAKLEVHIDGSAHHPPFSSKSGISGQAQIDFEMPKITSSEAAMVIRAEAGLGTGQLRFALRARPKVPSV